MIDEIDIWDNTLEPMPQRQPLFINWLDELLDGGMYPGDVMLFIAPSGHGKTVLGTQLCREMCCNNQYEVYLSYDQALEGDIKSRFFAMGAGVPKEVIRTGGIAGLPPEARERLAVDRERHGQFLLPFDLSQGTKGSGGVPEIEGIVNHLIARQKKPTLVVVDWLSTAVNKQMRNASQRPAPQSRYIEAFAKDFSRLCQRQGLVGVVLQQMAAAVSDDYEVEPHWMRTADCKTVAFFCQYVLGMARPKKGEGTMVLSKSRSGSLEDKSVKIRLRGDLNKFEVVEEEDPPWGPWDE